MILRRCSLFAAGRLNLCEVFMVPIIYIEGKGDVLYKFTKYFGFALQ